MGSRTLDDLAELALPAGVLFGGLYLVWWTTKALDKGVDVAIGASPGWNRLTDWLNPLGEGEFIDRWTLNPQEASGALSSAVKKTKRAAANLFSWTKTKTRNLRWY